MGRSVSEAEAQAVRKSEKTKAVDRTPEQIFTDIRRNLGAKLAVTPMDTAFLLAQYDQVKVFMVQGTNLLRNATDSLLLADAVIADLKAKNDEEIGLNGILLEANNNAGLEIRRLELVVTDLREKNDEFRTVYEAENRSQSVKVERVATPVVMEGDNQ